MKSQISRHIYVQMPLSFAKLHLLLHLMTKNDFLQVAAAVSAATQSCLQVCPGLGFQTPNISLMGS